MNYPLYLAEDYGRVYNFLWGVIAAFGLSICFVIAGTLLKRRQEDKKKKAGLCLLIVGGLGFAVTGAALFIALT